MPGTAAKLLSIPPLSADAIGKFAGGEGGIRTPDTRQGMSAFEADRFNRSRTSPRQESREWNRDSHSEIIEVYRTKLPSPQAGYREGSPLAKRGSGSC
jgi:hypothetical protein